MGKIIYSKKDLQIKIIGHFDGYICGMVSSLRYFDIIDYIHLADQERPITTYQFHTIEEYDFISKKIKEKVKEYSI